MKIMFDAGHGYNTAGKRSPDGVIREWAVNDKIVDELILLAAKYENLQVARADDPTGQRDVPLKERTDKANAWKADAYISVHQNAFGSGWNEADGVETYVYITKPAGSLKLAKNIQSQIISQLKVDDRGVKFADFHVLRETDMDAALVECGFMTNHLEAAKMQSISWIKWIADAIMDGIVQTYDLKLKPVPKPEPKPVTPAKVVTTKSGSAVHRVIVDGKQVGAYGNDESIANLVRQHLVNNPRSIVIELVK